MSRIGELTNRARRSLLVFACAYPGCEPVLEIGAFVCPAGSRATVDPDVVVPSSWSSGFENGFCDYSGPGRYCYADEEGSYTLVNSPVHSGNSAAAFTITTYDDETGAQARCVLQGQLPEEAHYGAWYYIETAAENRDNWNLFHFEGGTTEAPSKLWDVSLSSPDGSPPRVYVYDFLRGRAVQTTTPVVPIGEWFHLEFHWRRATDDTGAVTVYQDDEVALELTGLQTADSDVGTWYLGNLANALTPSMSTVYIDDVTIRTTR